MAEAQRVVQDGTPLPFWLLAETQTAARGRRGRPWQSEPGNFFASYACRAPAQAEASALRSFVTALAMYDALEAVGTAADDMALKWPNDVLVRGRKIAGILLEATTIKSQPLLVIGIGVNLATPPPVDALEAQALPPIALGEIGLTVAPDSFLDALAPSLAQWDARLTEQGFAPLRSAWLAITSAQSDSEFSSCPWPKLKRND